VTPSIIKVTLLFAGINEDEVVRFTVTVFELTEQVTDETAIPLIEQEQTEVPIVKSVGNVIFIAGLLPNCLLSKKLKVKLETAFITVEVRTRVPFELLKVAAVAVMVALRWRY
jgi:hypothetical protein